MKTMTCAIAVTLLTAACGGSPPAESPGTPPPGGTSSPTTAGDGAAPVAKELDYKHGDTVLQGYVAYPAGAAKAPGVLVVHEWWGHNAHARKQAERLAKAGFVGFALDMYGKGKVAKHPDDAKAFMTEATSDPEALRGRFDAALAQLRADPRVDPERVAAFGYCFGGAVALGMARKGADLDAVVTFHGALGTKEPAGKGAVKARILVLHGGADPMIPPEQVQGFEKEMTEAGAKFQVVTYPAAKHGFTNPDADKAGMPALGYDPDADARSWDAAMALLREVFP